jgi:membrane protease YdiL (CAAX protease family)
LPSFESTPRARTDRMLQLALFVTSLVWIVCAHSLASSAANGIALRFLLPSGRPLLSSLFFLFLLAVGFSMLQALSKGPSSLREVLGLPKRPTASREWALGAAIGWGCIVLAVLPMAVAGSLQVDLWASPRSFWLAILNLAAIAVSSLAEEVAFRGFPFRRLITAVGPTAATIFLSVFFGFVHVFNAGATLTSVLITILAGILLSVAWLRTHGLWLPWGFHFAWNASMGVLFGLPVSGLTDFSSVIQTRAFGRLWLTGGDYGPEAALFTSIVLVLAVAVLVRVTRDYAWNYTYVPIVAAGYAMEAQPPAAHVAMEQQSRPAPPPPLVQILPTTPQSRSVTDEPKS